jgi:hypothetical protein
MSIKSPYKEAGYSSASVIHNPAKARIKKKSKDTLKYAMKVKIKNEQIWPSMIQSINAERNRQKRG